MKAYHIVTTKKDPQVSFKIPVKILRDLVLRARENGYNLETEISLRLARSLERDLIMIDNDNQLILQAFDALYGGE